MSFPKDLKYTKDHEWAKLDGKKVTVGITDHAQSSLGDIVFLELPKVGTELKKGQTFGVVESVKAVSDLYSPVSGKVTEINSSLTDEAGSINRAPYDSWLITLQVTEPKQLDELMNADAYAKYVKELS